MASGIGRDARIETVVPLTPLQRGLVFASLNASGDDPYVVQLTARIDGDLDPAAFAHAWNVITQAHAVLRTAFVTKGQREPVQAVFANAAMPVESLDWRGLEPAEIAAAQMRLLATDRARGFALNRPPLARILLARLADRSWWVLFSHHHLILDGWSQPIVLGELFAVLEATAAGVSIELPTRPAFAAYATWLRAQDTGASATFWRANLANWSPTVLPRSNVRVPADAPTAHVEERIVDARTTAGLEALARAARVTPSTVFQAAWARTLERFAGPDVLFGVTISGRTASVPGIERMVGMLVNTLPLRLTVPASISARAWLPQVQSAFGAVESFGYADLAEIGRVVGATAERPLFATVLAYENFPVAFSAASASTLRIADARAHERTDLAVAAVVVPGTTTTIRLRVDPTQIPLSVAGQLGDLFLALLGHMAAEPDAPLAAFAGGLGNRAPRVALPGGDRGATLATRLRRSAAAYPERIAVTDDDGAYDYRALTAAAERIAAALERLGIACEDRVLLCFGRTRAAVAAMVGVAFAGGAYVPVDPAYPDDRIAATLADAGARVVLTTTAHAARLAALGAHVLAVDALPVDGADFAPARPEFRATDGANAAYVIYTSGSTGRPKGVVVSNANALRLFDGAARHFALGPNDVWSVFHSFAFDFSVWEIWGALLHGGRAAIVSYEASRDPAAFRALLAREGVTMLSQTPTAFALLVEADALAPEPLVALREIVLGGEAANPVAFAPWFARYGDRSPRVDNMYGITETTVHVTFRPLATEDASRAVSPLGEALPHLDILLLDDRGRPVPAGVAGEICVAGDGLARGYLGMPGITAERFVPHPHPMVPGERLYRSGYLASRTESGELAFLGRNDRQVKVHGFRIELGEIESGLRAFPGIAQAAVVVRPDAGGLIAYVVASAAGALDADVGQTLRAHLAERLPAHMLPGAYVVIPALPLTVNGKLDHAALPVPERAASREAASDEPETPVERAIADAWASVLGIARVGRDENYFALGGDSIRSIRIVHLASAAGVRFSVRDVLANPTVRSLAAVASLAASGAEPESHGPAPFALLAEGERAIVPTDAVDAFPLARLQAGMLFHADETGRALYHDSQSFRLEMPVDEAAFRAAFDETIAAFAALRTGFVLGRGKRPLQFVLPQATAPFVWSDLRDRSEVEREATIALDIERDRARPYDLEAPPLVRVRFHRLAGDLVQLSIAFHHAILDGWSVALWEAALLERYFAIRSGVPLPLPALGRSYAAFVAAEEEASADPAIRALWESRLARRPAMELPRWPGAPAADAAVPYIFPPEVGRALGARAAAAGLPLKAILLAIVGHVVARATGSDATAIGLVVNGRAEAEGGDRDLGLFLNTIPLVLEGRGRWGDLARAAVADETAVLAGRRFPLQELVRMAGGSHPFACNVNVVNFHAFAGLSARFPVRVVGASTTEAIDIPFSFNFSLHPDDGTLGFSLLASHDVSAAQRTALERAIRDGIVDAARSLATEADALPRPPVVPPAPARATALVHERVLANFARATGHVVRDATGRRFTGSEMLALANAAAARLGAIPRGTPVLLLVPRGPGLVAAMLAVLRAGGCYVPLDASAPTGRIATILEELAASGAAPVVLCAASERARVPDAWRSAIRDADGPLPADAGVPEAPIVDAADAAYAIFTSGSTGRPKGVAIAHGAFANHTAWMERTFPLAPDDVIAQRTSPAFDAAVWEFWAPLVEGALLAFVPEAAIRDPEELVRALGGAGATVVQLVPSLVSAVLALASGRALRVRRLFCGGEPLASALAADALARFAGEVVNLYGPTEATIDATFRRFTEADAAERIVAIGAPIDGMAAYVLDAHGEPVALGAPGELYLAGAGLARGYLGLRAMTAERFVPDPFAADGTRMYRTGDRAMLLPDGALRFLGRNDRQIKIGGNRLELDEVEAVLGRTPGLGRVAVVAEGTDEAKHLVAYLEGDPFAATVAAANTWLGERLPGYAIPRRMRFVATWPTLASGKTDRARLAGLGLALAHAQPVPTAGFANAREAALAAIWDDVLGHVGTGPLDDFFRLGGDSILALQLAARARREGFGIGPGDVFRTPTVRGLCAAVASATPGRGVPEPIRDAVPLAPIQRWFFGLGLARPQHWNQAVLLRSPKGLAAERLMAIAAVLARRHDALAVRFQADEHGWTMLHGTPAIAVDERDCADAAAVTAACRDAQSSLDFTRGPLLRIRAMRLAADADDRLLLVAHHLIVDGVSWRVLLDDLAALLADPAADLGAAPYPFTALTVARNAAAPAPEEEAYWRGEALRPLATLPRAHAEPPIEGRTQSRTQTLDRAVTATLTGATLERLRAEMPELLLAALGQALTDELGETDTGVLLERHGRDAVAEIDASETLGWLTVLHPVRLRARHETCAAIRAAKEALRRIPQAGAGYLTLAARGSGAAPPLPEIALNYLGRFDAQFTGALRPASEETGPASDPANRRSTLADLVALVVDGELQITLAFDAHVLGAERATALLGRFVAGLARIAAIDAAQAVGTWVAGDLPGVALGNASLARIAAEIPRLVAIYPVSATAEGILFEARMAGAASGVYVQQATIDLVGTVDLARLHGAWTTLVRRHEALRSAFIVHDDVPLQVVCEGVALPFAFEDWTDTPPAERDARWDRLLAEDRAAGFAFDAAPLMRVRAVRLEPERLRLLWTHHHLIMDGWSMPLAFADLVAAYRDPASLPPAPSLAALVRHTVAGDHATRVRAFAGELRGATRAFVAPVARGNGSAATYARALAPQAAAALRGVVRAAGVGIASAINAAFALALSRSLGVAEVLHGVTVAGRPADVANSATTVGMFIATLPMRTALRGDRSIDALLRDVHARLGTLNERASVSLPAVQAALGGGPLFDAIVVVQNYPAVAARADDAGFRVEPVVTSEQNHYPLSLYASTGGDAIEMTLRYDPDRVAVSMAEAFLDAVCVALTAWASESASTVGATPSVTADARRALVALGTGAEAAVTASLDDRIAAQARATPDAIAVIAGDERLSYAALVARADAIAAALSARGIGVEDRVAVMLPRKIDLPVALLGVLRAGAAFVPLDTRTPAARVASVLASSGATLLIADGAIALADVPCASVPQLLAEADVLPASAALRAVPLQALAYVIYTSGSTGEPKGVAIAREAFANASEAFRVRPGLRADDVIAAVTTVGFDIALNELLVPLTCGATVALVSRADAANGARLVPVLRDCGATVLQATPTTWRMLLAAGWTGGVRAWCGGEALPADLARELAAHGTELWNLYGPTETTIWSALGRVAPGSTVEVGTAIPNTRLLILDDDGNLLPPGVTGELAIGGLGLARGYVGKPASTAAAFVPDPTAPEPGARAYRTGDLARFAPDGGLRILGRRDRQVKIQGYRIEPAETEIALRAVPGVIDAACVVRSLAGAPALVGYVVLERPEIAIDDVRGAISAVLPAYLIPGRIIALPRLPTNASGKTDYGKLPDPETMVALGTVNGLPNGPIEEALLIVWGEAFKREGIGTADDFFELGGHSLLATQVHATIERLFAGGIALRALFDTPTIAGLARHLASDPVRRSDVTRAAETFVKLRSMTPEERAALRARAQKRALVDEGAPR